MTQGNVEISDPVSTEVENDIIGALGLSSSDQDTRFPIQIVSTGHSKVMVGINSRNTLNMLEPDLIRLVSISKKIGCDGYFVFTLDSDDSEILSHGRMFAPAIGISEDPVTGNANGPLGAYLVHKNFFEITDGSVTFNGKQGESIGRPGVVTVTVEVKKGKPFKVQVGGDALIAFKTKIKI